MKKKNPWIVLVSFVLLTACVLGLSLVSMQQWGGKPEETPEAQPLVWQDDMTVADFGQQNGLPNPTLKTLFGLTSPADLQKKVTEFGLTREDVLAQAGKTKTLTAEYESKNWIKIPLKFGLWIVFLAVVFVLLRKRRITPAVRKWLYLIAVAVFGVVMGSDPSPMGTVKDAIALLGAKGVVFPPRMIALTVFLTMVLLANKFICAWGCQLGTLQDLIFRLNRDGQDKTGVLRQYKPPFAVTNGIRIAFFVVFTIAAFVWATDIIDPVDPFKTFKPAVLGLGGGLFIAGILVLSLFIYRPWCHLFCPFGLVGWLVEKIGLFHVKVDYDTCIACEACAKACPSTVMNAILKRGRVIPDCFACGVCLGVCPTGSIRFDAGRRSKPPVGHFDRKRTKPKPGAVPAAQDQPMA